MDQKYKEQFGIEKLDLGDCFDIVGNNHTCVTLKVKPNSQQKLITTGVFNGSEEYIRVYKNTKEKDWFSSNKIEIFGENKEDYYLEIKGKKDEIPQDSPYGSFSSFSIQNKEHYNIYKQSILSKYIDETDDYTARLLENKISNLMGFIEFDNQIDTNSNFYNTLPCNSYVEDVIKEDELAPQKALDKILLTIDKWAEVNGPEAADTLTGLAYGAMLSANGVDPTNSFNPTPVDIANSKIVSKMIKRFKNFFKSHPNLPGANILSKTITDRYYNKKQDEIDNAPNPFIEHDKKLANENKKASKKDITNTIKSSKSTTKSTPQKDAR